MALARGRASAWSVFLAVGVLATGGYYALPSVIAQSAAYDLFGLAAVAAILVGIRWHRPAARLPWLLLALGDALAVAGDLIWTYDQAVRGTQTPVPSIADALYLGGALVFFVGVVLLVRGRTGARDYATLLDTAILAIGGGILSWVLLITPPMHDTTRPLAERLAAGAYPAVDVLILAAATRLALGLERRTTPLRLLLLALACNLATDFAYTTLLAGGWYQTGHPIDAGWLLAYVLHGAMALHPAMRERLALAPADDLPRGRLTLLALATLIGPALLAVQTARGAPIDVGVVVGASTVLALLALARLRLLAAALRRREARFRALVLQADEGIAIVDEAGRTTYLSPSVARIIGFAPEALLGADIFARVHPDDIDRVRARFAALLARPGATGTCDLRARRADGAWCVLEVRGTNLLAEPAVGGVVINYRDITAREEAGAALRASEARLAEAQRIAHLGSWEFDIARGELSWSDEVFRIAGHAPQSFAPTPDRMLAAVHPDDRARVSAAIAASLERGEVYDLDHRIVRPDGEVRVVHQQAELVRDDDGRPVKRIGVVQDVTEQRALEARLAHQATHDALTGLPNRALFLDRLEQALARARREGPAGTVLFLDLDHFKDVNDSLGHAAGDRLLVAVAARLRGGLRDVDTLARLGGDEFAVLLAGIAPPGAAARAAARLARALDPPILLDGQEYRVGVSIGVVLASGVYARAEEVLRDADVAMYRAKASGRGQYAVFDPAMQAAVTARLALERDLRQALDRDELRLHYQPIVELRGGRVIRAEALLRWQHPERGLVAPDEFIPLAEETGLIRPLGRRVLRAACLQAAAWAAAGTPVAVAVNLTAQEFQQPELVDEVAAALAEARLAPRWLSLEITESLAMRDIAATVATLTALRAMGVGTAIDDFGTGYSSLAALKRLPVDTIKIDRAFISGLATDAADTAIVAAIVTLAHTLGVLVVAEGVELAAQGGHLRALGCDLAQGYHFSRPLPAAELAGLLADRAAPRGTHPHLAIARR